jgi:hypothetical protein
MGASSPILIALRRRPEAVVSGESGFVLILVLPAALMLIMTALSLVSRSNSATMSGSRELRAKGALMAAEYGFNQMMGLLNTEYDTSKPISFVDNENVIVGSPASSYTILSFNPPYPPVTCSDISNEGNDVYVSIMGKLKVGSTTYTQVVNRSLRICAPADKPNQLRVRAFH